MNGAGEWDEFIHCKGELIILTTSPWLLNVFFGQAIQNMEKIGRFGYHKRSQSEKLSTKKRSFQ